jgi:hypothetical protein
MGGYGSGRSGGRPTVEDTLTLDLRRLFEDGFLKVGAWTYGTLRWTIISRGEEIASVDFQSPWVRTQAIFGFIGPPETTGPAKRTYVKTALRLRPANSPLAVGVGFSSARTRAKAPRSSICPLELLPSPVGKPIGLAIGLNAKRRVIALCPEPSLYVEKLAAREESATTLKSQKACTGALSNASWKEFIGRRGSLTRNSLFCSIGG